MLKQLFLNFFFFRLTPSNLVNRDPQQEVLIRTCESMISRALSSSTASRGLESVHNVETLIDGIYPLNESQGFQHLKQNLLLQNRDTSETLLFQAFSIRHGISTYCCQVPNLNLGFGEGLVLCKVLLGNPQDVNQKGDSIFLKEVPLKSQLNFQPGRKFICFKVNNNFISITFRKRLPSERQESNIANCGHKIQRGIRASFVCELSLRGWIFQLIFELFSTS